MSTRGDIIGDRVADALNSPPLDVSSGTLDERKHRIWRAICNALEPWFEPAWIDIYVDPTVTPVYIEGTTPYPYETVAWQLTPTTDVPILAIWIKYGSGTYEWSKLWSSSGIDDHLVKARNSDATAVGGLLEKTIDSLTVTRTLVTDAGVEKIQFNAVPQTPAQQQTSGSRLYPARINDPYPYHVRGILQTNRAYGNEAGEYNFGGGSTWRPIAGVSTWERDQVGVIFLSGTLYNPAGTSFSDVMPAAAGDLCLVGWGSNDPDIPPEHEADYPFFWIYEILNPGSATEKSVIRRYASADLKNGAVAVIDDWTHAVGLSTYHPTHYGKYFTINVDGPITENVTPVTLTMSSSYVSSTSYDLRTSYQLAIAGALLESGESSNAAIVTSSAPAYIEIPRAYWLSLAGTPNLTTRAAGRWSAQGKFGARMEDEGDPQGAVTYAYELRLRHLDGSFDTLPFLSVAFPSCAADSETRVLTAQADDAGGAQLDTDRWGLWVKVSTDSSYPIIASWSAWDVDRSSWIQPPYTVGLPESDHQTLSGRFPKVQNGEAPAHAWDGISGGRAHGGIGTGSIDGSGIVTCADANTTKLILSNGETINGIVNSGWLDGDRHLLAIYGATRTATVKVANGASVGTGKLCFYLPHMSGTDANARIARHEIKASPAFLDLIVDPTVGVYLKELPSP